MLTTIRQANFGVTTVSKATLLAGCNVDSIHMLASVTTCGIIKKEEMVGVLPAAFLLHFRKRRRTAEQ